MFSFEFREIFKNTFFTEFLLWLLLLGGWAYFAQEEVVISMREGGGGLRPRMNEMVVVIRSVIKILYKALSFNSLMADAHVI